MHDLPLIIFAIVAMTSVVWGPIFLIWYLLRNRKRRKLMAAMPQRRVLEGEDKSYTYFRNPKSRNRSVAGIAIGAPLAFDFRLEPLDAFDKLAAALGFATPVPSGDPLFDDQIYSYSTNPFFCQLLSSNAALRQTILDIFHSGVSAIVGENGQLVAMTNRAGKFVVRDGDDEYADVLAAQLHNCLRPIASVQVDKNDTSSRRAKQFDKSLRSVLGLVLIVGGISAFLCGSGAFYQLANLFPLVKLSLFYSVPVIVAAFLLLRGLMADTPYGADALRSFIQMGLLASAATVFTALYTVNIVLDKTAPIQRLQTIACTHYTTGKHNSHTYYVDVRDWNGPGTFAIRVQKQLYDMARPGQNFRLFSHPGFLNIEWISVP